MSARRFYDCTVSEKLLHTSFLLLVGVGYLMAISFLYVVSVNKDGKPGISIEDIAASYYGNRSGTRLEAAIRGPMAGYLQEEERHHVVAWLKDGAPQAGYEQEIKAIVDKNCIACHSKAAGMNLPDFTGYQGLREYAQVDTGMSVMSLLRLSHINLFGISLLLFALGYIFILSEVNVWFKRFLVLSPMVAVFVDILAWFLTKWDSHYAIVVVGAGAVLGFSMAAQIFISLYQIWFLKRPK